MTNDTYTIKPFPPSRHFFVDGMEFGGRKHCIHGLIEVDVTNPRQRIREIREQTGESLSFTGFIAYCCARVVHQNRLVHAYRDWRSRLILFDQVDIYVPVERSAGGLFSQAIIRAANQKSVKDIHREIRKAQSKAMPDTALQFSHRPSRCVWLEGWHLTGMGLALANRQARSVQQSYTDDRRRKAV